MIRSVALWQAWQPLEVCRIIGDHPPAARGEEPGLVRPYEESDGRNGGCEAGAARVQRSPIFRLQAGHASQPWSASTFRPTRICSPGVARYAYFGIPFGL